MLIALLFVLMCGLSFRIERQRRRHLRRLKGLLAQVVAPSDLVLHAESIGELQVWLTDKKNVLLPDEKHVRSLSRVVLYGIQQIPSTLHRAPPLVRFLAGSLTSLSHGELMVLFSRRIGPVVQFIHSKKPT